MNRWWVVSPEYGTVVPVCDDGTGPMEYGCDAVEVEADTKRDALLLGVQELLKRDDSWPSVNRQDGQPPWAGMRVEPSPPCDCCGEYEACSCKWTGQDPPYVCTAHTAGLTEERGE